MWKQFVRATVRQVLRPRPIRTLVERELAARRTAERVERSDPALIGRVFVDRHGTEHALDASLRDRLKPQWRTMCDPEAIARPPTDEALIGRARKAEKSVAEARQLVAAIAGADLEGRILEIGCYDGASAFQLARRPATEVVASDLARYYLVQRPGVETPRAADLDAQQTRLAALRDRASAVTGPVAGRVEFIEDDITATTLAPASFDAIVSFEVLEHVQRPAAAFEAMARLLKPGGIAYHDYNPFFSANGGHSLGTLDFAWGHARLDDADFERYVRDLRPAEADAAVRFNRESLNRMTMADLRQAVDAAGLELLAIVPWTDRKLVSQLTDAAIGEVRRNYPSATLADLLATFAVVIVRRPA